MIKFRALKIFVNGIFIDFLEPNELEKTIAVEEGAELFLKVDWCFSNKINANDLKGNNFFLNVTSQIQNGLFFLIFGSFFLGGILQLLHLLHPHFYLASILPLSIIVAWQTFGRKKYLRLTKMS